MDEIKGIKIPSINSQDGIAKYLGNLSDFSKILTIRKDIASLGEELSSFVILGNILLDNDGKVYLLQPEIIDPEIIDVVATMDEYIKIVGTNFTSMLLMDPPSTSDKCPVCGKGWNISNLSDYEYAPCLDVTKTGIQIYHVECLSFVDTFEKIREKVLPF